MPIRQLNINRIRTLNSFNDWLKKAKHEFKLYENTNSEYAMANCFLSLNAPSEWIVKSDSVAECLREVADKKFES